MAQKSLQGDGLTPTRQFRAPDDDWEPFLANTKSAGSNASKEILAFVRRYNARAARRAAHKATTSQTA